MKHYKLIKKLPFENSPETGYISKPKSDDAHYWNHNWFNPQDYPEFWELVVEKDYEILSLYNNVNPSFIINGKIEINIWLKGFDTENWSIHSVKRLSDFEIFTIGDKLNKSYISNILLQQDTIWLMCQGDSINSKLNDAIKIKQPLFITEDGVDIFEGDYYYPVEKTYYFLHEKQTNNHCTNDDKFWIFSTKEKAEEYILMNKPCLSLQEIVNSNGGKSVNGWEHLEELKKLVKQKLNN
jgi:hypothetical protein